MDTKSTETNRMNVSNIAQKIAFVYEMQGQISDGMWENTRPLDHWKAWSSLNWNTVQIKPNNIGRNFRPMKDNYNINAQDLVDIVGERLIFAIKFYKLFPEQAEKIYAAGYSFDSADSIDYYMEKSPKSEGQKEGRKAIEAAGVTKAMLQEAAKNETIYTMRDLRKDLAGLRKAMGTFNTDLDADKEPSREPRKQGRPKDEDIKTRIGKSAIPVTAPATKDAAPVAEPPARRAKIVKRNTSMGPINWNSEGWYQYDRRNRCWSKIEHIDHNNSNPIGFFAVEDLISE